MKFVQYGSLRERPTRAEIVYSAYLDKKKPVYSENGNREFVKVGQTDLYALAQSHKDACSIENIIKRATNDPSVLRRTVGSYVDITEVPTNMFDAMKVLQDAKKVFEGLSQTVKNTYNNSFDNFLGQFKTASGLARFVSAQRSNSQQAKTNENVEKVVNE